MKILLTGATGLLGRAIHSYFKSLKYNIIPTAFSRAKDDIHKLNLLDSIAVQKKLEDERPQIIIHTAAERRPDISEKDHKKTDAINVQATKDLCTTANSIDASLLYISTDYVFDGSTPPYNPNDKANPLNHYGKSKWQGEEAVRKSCNKHAVLRVPVLYGEVNELQESAITNIAASLLETTNSSIKIDHWASRYPTHVADIANVIHQMIQHKSQLLLQQGTYHWSSNQPYTKYEIALIMSDFLKLDKSMIQPLTETPSGTPRPKNCQLNTSELTKLNINKYSDFKTEIKKIIEKSIKDKEQ